VSRPAGHDRAIAAQLAMELRLTARRGESLLAMVVIPAAVLLFFASVPVLAIDGDVVGFLLPGSVALAIIAASLVNLGIATGYERHYGVLKRLGGSPLTRGDLVAAKLGAVLVVEIAQVALLLALAVGPLGWTPPGGAAPALAIAGVLLGTAAFAGLGLLLAGTLRAEGNLALANGLFIGSLLLGGVVVPVGHLPDSLAGLAMVLPAAALTDILRAATDGTGGAEASLVVLGAWAVAAAGAATRFFRWV